MKYQVSQAMFRRFRQHQPALPAYNASASFGWIQHQSGLPWLKLDIKVPYQIILSEIPNIQSHLTAHRQDLDEHKGWYSFCLHGKSYDATREDEHYDDLRPYTWTAEAEQFMPKTVDYFKQHWPGAEYQRVRIMLLEPGGYITVHRDCTQPRLYPINIAVTQPQDCSFVMENHGVIPFEPGDCYWLDVSNRHVVFNHSDQPRWHIIVHQDVEHLQFQSLVANSYKRLYNNNHDNG